MFFTLGLLAGLAGCGSEPAGRPADNLAEVEPAENLTAGALPAVEVPLTRRDILLAVANAASSTVATGSEGDAQARLDGRTFAFRIRFCDGDRANLQSSFDGETKVLRVKAEPDLQLGGDDDGAARAEGFWITRPWLLEATCPRVPEPNPAPEDEASAEPEPAPTTTPKPASASTAAPVRATVGLADYEGEGQERAETKQTRPYQLTKKLDADSAPAPLDLILKGRLHRRPDGKVISCTGDGRTAPPTCIVSVRIDQVQLEGGGAKLAEWTKGLAN